MEPPHEPLVGRTAELEALGRFVRGGVRRTGAEPPALVVTGDPGAGKTALSTQLAREEAQRGVTVLRATGVQSEVDVGFAGLSQLLGPVVDRVHQLPAELRDDLYAALGFDDPQPGRALQVAAAVRTLLAGLARASPVLVVVDDLQWTDPATADVLSRTVRSLGAADVRVLVLVRTAARTYFDTSGLSRLALGPLAARDAEALVRSAFPDVDRFVVARVLAEADGNPLALLELPTALTAHERTAQRELPAYLPLTERLQALYGGRVLPLAADTRHRLLVAALGGSEMTALAHDRSEHARLLAPAEQAGLLQLEPDGVVRFRHPLVRSTVVDLSTAQERRRAHLFLAHRGDSDEDRAAWHRAAATLGPDEEVAHLLEAAAGRALSRGDTAGAVRTLIRAAELSPERADRARRLAEAAYRGADVGGDLRRAARLLEDAARADPDSGQTLEAAIATAYLLLNGAGDTRTAHRVIVAALDEAWRTGNAAADVVVEGVHTLCEICIYAAQPDLWPAYHAAAERVPLEQFPVLALWDRILVDPARSARPTLAALEDALSSLGDEQDPVRVERVAAAALYVDRVDSARQPLLGLLDAARAGTSTGSGILALMLLAVEDFHRGRWSDARAFAEEGLQLADEHGLDLLAWPLKLTQAWLAAGTGDHRALQSLLDQMHAWATPRQVGTVLDYAHHAAGLGALGRGDYLTAFSELSQVSSPGELRSHVGHALWAAMDLVEAAVHAGHKDAAAAHVSAMRRAGVGELSGRLRLVEAGAAAMAAEELDRELFDQALATPDAEHWPFELARIRLCYGQLLRRDRAAADARRHLESALSTFRDLGATDWVHRAQQELEATSQVKRRAGRHDVLSLLTPQEHQVATLASRGLTNQQIAERLLMSPRTAGAHLRGVYRKLGVAGRGGLHQALADPLGATAAPIGRS